jgi:hypothetical protein
LERNTAGKAVSGTVEGLVAYITSPDCLDYEVLSDFFMMYRKFMDPSKLLALLCARFEWGLLRGAPVKPPDNEGMIQSFRADSRHGTRPDVCSSSSLASKLLRRRFRPIAKSPITVYICHQFFWKRQSG